MKIKLNEKYVSKNGWIVYFYLKHTQSKGKCLHGFATKDDLCEKFTWLVETGECADAPIGHYKKDDFNIISEYVDPEIDKLNYIIDKQDRRALELYVPPKKLKIAKDMLESAWETSSMGSSGSGKECKYCASIFVEISYALKQIKELS